MIGADKNNNNSKETFYSVSEAKQASRSCRDVTVTGMIASYSTLYKTISKSEWECSNLPCNNQGSQTYTPPILLPPEDLDNRSGDSDFGLKCPKCKSTAFTVTHSYRNTRSIQLEDVCKTTYSNASQREVGQEEGETTNSIDRLEVLLYDNASSHIIPGEITDIIGNIYIQRKSDSGSGKSSKKLVSVLHGNEIRYKNKAKVIITPKDVEIFDKHKRICNGVYLRELEAAARLNHGELTEHKIVPMKYIDRLIAMFAPNVIGHSDAKLGILRSLVGGKTDHGDDNGRRGRVNTLLPGDPGTAKSIIAKEATKIMQNSRYVTAQNASGKSLVGVVDKENDGLFLRLGAAVLAKGAVCAVNEIGTMSPEDQGHLTDIAEEGRCTLDKYGTHFELDAPTTIVATANPYNTRWNSDGTISKDEIPVLRTLIDRFDQIYAFRDAPSELELKDYTSQKTRIRKRRPHNYNFLRKLLTYAKSLNPQMTRDTEYRLNKFWSKARLKDVATNRTYDSIFRLAEAQAKLNLSNEIDDEIATQAMDSISLMLSQYGSIVEIVQSPRDVTYRAFLDILKQTKAALSIEEICRLACEENRQIHQYLGNKFKIRDNRKLRTVVDMLLNHGSIKQIQEHPIVLQWLGDLNDLRDTKTNSIADSDYMKSELRSPMSLKSLTTHSNAESEVKLEESQIRSSIYRMYGDTWGCRNCRVRDDKWGMIKHKCGGVN